MTQKKEDISNFYGHSVSTTSFLAGITFATMVLLIDFGKDLVYKEPLITATAIVSMLFIISTLGMMRVASNQIAENDVFTKFAKYTGGIAFLIFMGVIPSLLIQISFFGGLVLIGLEVFILFFFLKYAKSKK